MTENNEKKPNRLINEKSPYLLEHAYNPVDWYPWGSEAFQKAKRENKPILLSIGYSSCHWCHVLRKESFEDLDTAKFMNENFVSVKVDREERPDVDEVYMKAVMSLTGSGGWPLTLFLTPSLEPFFGGTYFPPTPRYGMPSFINVLKGISGSWKTERKTIVESAARLKKALNELYQFKKNGSQNLNLFILDECFSSLASSFDEIHGGFSSSPKFPMPSNIIFLTRYATLKNSRLAMQIVARTLDSMMRGGIYDQIGGGFHRYSTDRYWIVPHFEKMLYDNALLIAAYTEVFLISKNEEYARVVKMTIEWAERELLSKEGGFCSSIDADSEDGEGGYYVWNPPQIREALAEEPGLVDVVMRFFSITDDGNFENGKTILTAKPLHVAAKEAGLQESELVEKIARAKKSMLEYRDKRKKPSIDDKVITSWNGLMISALSKAYCAFGDKKYLDLAIGAAEHILKELLTSEGTRLSRSYRDGESRGDGVLEDYSFLVNGLIDLYEASFETKYLLTAISICESMVKKFEDSNGGFFLTEAGVRDLIVRAKDSNDGAIPSGNSVSALVLSRLAEFTERDNLRILAKKTFETFWGNMENQPSAYSHMMVALQFHLAQVKEIVISGKKESEKTRELVKAIRSVFLPHSVVVLADEKLSTVSPLVHGRISADPLGSRVYVCTNFSCKLPTSSREELLASLHEQYNLRPTLSEQT